MRTEAKIRRRVGAYESRPFTSCLSNSYYGVEELFSRSVSKAQVAETTAAKANAMHAIIADAPVNTDFRCIIKLDKEETNVQIDE